LPDRRGGAGRYSTLATVSIFLSGFGGFGLLGDGFSLSTCAAIAAPRASPIE
jgi:hypothetical protein